jgi:hypothetical protein
MYMSFLVIILFFTERRKMPTVRISNIRLFWLVLALIVFGGHAGLEAKEPPPDTIVETALIWINQARAQEGLHSLSFDPRLNEAARAHSEQMADHGMLSESDPALGTPYERIRAKGLTDTNSLVVVVRARDWDGLREQLESTENLSRILSPEMTHVGVGIVLDPDGDLWLTVHMTERAITFIQFTLSQSSGLPVIRSMSIKGNTPHEKIKVLLVPPEGSKPDLAVERIVVPDSNGDFEVTLPFGAAIGHFGLEFSVPKDGSYTLKNFFSMDIG